MLLTKRIVIKKLGINNLILIKSENFQQWDVMNEEGTIFFFDGEEGPISVFVNLFLELLKCKCLTAQSKNENCEK